MLPLLGLRPLGGRLGLVLLLLLRGLLPAAAARVVLVVHGARCSRATVAFFSCRGFLLRFGPELLLDVSSRYGDHRRLRIWKRKERSGRWSPGRVGRRPESGDICRATAASRPLASPGERPFRRLRQTRVPVRALTQRFSSKFIDFQAAASGALLAALGRRLHVQNASTDSRGGPRRLRGPGLSLCGVRFTTPLPQLQRPRALRRRRSPLLPTARCVVGGTCRGEHEAGAWPRSRRSVCRKGATARGRARGGGDNSRLPRGTALAWGVVGGASQPGAGKGWGRKLPTALPSPGRRVGRTSRRLPSLHAGRCRVLALSSSRARDAEVGLEKLRGGFVAAPALKRRYPRRRVGSEHDSPLRQVSDQWMGLWLGSVRTQSPRTGLVTGRND